MATGRLVQKDWYSMLGAKSTDSLTELKQKYQKLAIKYHPDKQSADVPAGELEERVQRFIEIDQAWKILGNEETKKEYDLQQRESELTHYWPIDAHVHLEDMSWDSGGQEKADLNDSCSADAILLTLSNSTSSLVAVLEELDEFGRASGFQLKNATHLFVVVGESTHSARMRPKMFPWFAVIHAR
ncbi:dnaJ homolog subfamily C member 24 isoform X1 [Ambystoma mexicanum]|uniref:dnaJ homolog subfamily C member 24 isoform X1 n=1 Tax=Ambystoma mexicanum TaxID=8296 RepID=UPI0037E83F8D